MERILHATSSVALMIDQRLRSIAWFVGQWVVGGTPKAGQPAERLQTISLNTLSPAG